MKRYGYIVVAVAMMASAVAFAACPPVTLSDSCAMKATIDEEAAGFVGIMALLKVTLDEWGTADNDGDGMPDQAQTDLLSAVLCSDDATVTGQFTANEAAYNTVVGALGNALTAADPALPNQMTAAATALGTLNTAVGGTELASSIGALLTATISGLNSGAAGLAGAEGDLALYEGYAQLLGGLTEYAAAQGGLSTGSKAFMEGELTGIASTVVKAGNKAVTNATQLGTIAAALTNDTYMSGVLVANGVPSAYISSIIAGWDSFKAGYSATLVVPAQTALATAAGTMNTFGSSLAAMTSPSFTIYSCGGKDSGEPFSGAGDYDGNGDTNLQVYNAVGGGAAFVAAASGAAPFYNGNPSLPVAGIIGLAMLAGACVMGGAASIRRK